MLSPWELEDIPAILPPKQPLSRIGIPVGAPSVNSIAININVSGGPGQPDFQIPSRMNLLGGPILPLPIGARTELKLKPPKKIEASKTVAKEALSGKPSSEKKSGDRKEESGKVEKKVKKAKDPKPPKEFPCQICEVRHFQNCTHKSL